MRARLRVFEVRALFSVWNCGAGVEEGRWRLGGPILVVLRSVLLTDWEGSSLSDEEAESISVPDFWLLLEEDEGG